MGIYHLFDATPLAQSRIQSTETVVRESGILRQIDSATVLEDDLVQLVEQPKGVWSCHRQIQSERVAARWK